jgi:hypothetical protein
MPKCNGFASFTLCKLKFVTVATADICAGIINLMTMDQFFFCN